MKEHVFRIICALVAVIMVTPAAIQAAQTPATASVDQVALYTEQQQALTSQGQDLVSLFLTGDDAAFLDRSNEAVQQAFQGTSFDRILQQLETNRLAMTLPQTGGEFSGYVDNGARIAGTYHDGSSHSFRLQADQPQSDGSLAGRWTGTILPEGIEIAITFSGANDALTATIDMPSGDLQGVPLADVAFAAEQPIGEVVNSQALPMSPKLRSYTEVRRWGSGFLVLYLLLDSSGTVTRFRFTVPNQPRQDSGEHDGDIAYQLPASEQLIVFWGGQNEPPSYHSGLTGWRYGYEFGVWRNGSTYSGDGSRNENYYIWGMPVSAPVDGTVVAIENAMPDLAPGESLPTRDAAAASPADHLGNHLVIESATGDYVVIAHLQQGSVPVAVGDTVAAGDQVGLVGHSGIAPEPLLHLHAQSTAGLADGSAQGVPIVFGDVVINDTAITDVAAPHRGQFIAPAGLPYPFSDSVM